MLHSRLHRLIALLTLTAHLLVGTSVLPATALLLAQLDGSHEIAVSSGPTGMKLVLKHRPQDFTPQACDHASNVGRVLVAFFTSNSEGSHCLTSLLANETLSSESTQLSGKKVQPAWETQLALPPLSIESRCLANPAKLPRWLKPQQIALSSAGALRSLATVQLLC